MRNVFRDAFIGAFLAALTAIFAYGAVNTMLSYPPASTMVGNEAFWCMQPPVVSPGNDHYCTAKQIAQTLFLFSLKEPIRNASSPSDAWVAGTDYMLAVTTSSTPQTETLPANPSNGDTYAVKDASGNAATNNITINGNGNNIEGSGSVTISTNWGNAAFTYSSAFGLWLQN
jgi:hypothetical protein